MPEINIKEIDENAIHKEVFNAESVEVKTELTGLQVNAITKMKAYGYLTGNDILNKYSNYFMSLQLSKDRKSRAEFIESMNRKQELDKQKLLNNMPNMLG
jgi:hypothetical protein